LECKAGARNCSGNFISRRETLNFSKRIHCAEDLIFSENHPAVALRHVRLRHVGVAEVNLVDDKFLIAKSPPNA
jgi:hypothetical protein